MHVLTSVVGYLLGSLLLIALTILATIQSIIGNQRLFDTQTKFICRWIPGVFGIRVITMGAENIDKAATQIFMANHVNIFDGFILYGHIPNFFRGIELEDHFSWPIWGFITKRLGNIPISHTNIESAVESLNRAREALSNGTSIGILPEGHRTRDGELQPFKRGAFRLAKNADVGVTPVAIRNLWERKTVHSPLVRPGIVYLVFGETIAAETAHGLSERELRDLVKSRIQRMLEDPKEALRK
jgi:1-acyl-sn-glycerol-3-phosphate acyltransferase